MYDLIPYFNLEHRMKQQLVRTAYDLYQLSFFLPNEAHIELRTTKNRVKQALKEEFFSAYQTEADLTLALFKPITATIMCAIDAIASVVDVIKHLYAAIKFALSSEGDSAVYNLKRTGLDFLMAITAAALTLLSPIIYIAAIFTRLCASILSIEPDDMDFQQPPCCMGYNAFGGPSDATNITSDVTEGWSMG